MCAEISVHDFGDCAVPALSSELNENNVFRLPFECIFKCNNMEHQARFYSIAAIVMFILGAAFFFAFSSPPADHPPRGPLEIRVGPISEAQLNKTEVFVDVPSRKLNVRVSFRFNDTTTKYFIYVLLPYHVLNSTAYAIYNGGFYPHELPPDGPDVGTFSTNRWFNATTYSSVVNASLIVNSSFSWSFSDLDMKDELTLGVSIEVQDSLVAVDYKFETSQTVILTFFGDTTGIISDEMHAFQQPSSKTTLDQSFIVNIGIPPSAYYSNSQPAPIGYYMKEGNRWVKFSIDFLEGRSAQTLMCTFNNPTTQAWRQIFVFVGGVFTALGGSFIVQAVRYHLEGKRQAPSEPPTVTSLQNAQKASKTKDLAALVDRSHEKRLWFIYVSNPLLVGTFICYAILVGVFWFLLYTISLAIARVQGDILIPALISLVAAMISLMGLVNNLIGTLSSVERYEKVVEYNYSRMKKQVNEADWPILKALIRMKSKNPEFKLGELSNKTLLTKNRLLERLYE